jgi:predicted cupin superfamily sugar epimerase
MPCDASTPLPPRAAELVHELGMRPHPEGGWYAEVFRSSCSVQPNDDRPARAALTTIDFLLARGQFSAWHRVRSDEVWHLLEGGPLRLWTLAPAGQRPTFIDLGAGCRRHVVAAGWWQAAEPLGGFAYVGATVGPGFDFADFAFGRDHPALHTVLGDLERLL